MKKQININMSADITIEDATEIISEYITELTGKNVSNVIYKYDENGRFDGFHIKFNNDNILPTQTAIDKSFRPIAYI